MTFFSNRVKGATIAAVLTSQLIFSFLAHAAVPSFTPAQPGHGYYQGLPKKLSANELNGPQKWDKYCPPCSLKNQSMCDKLPCQTHNLKMGTAYEGIAAKSDKWMRMANQEALYGVKHGGGPFGAVIVQIDDKTGKVIRYWKDYNHVEKWQDPTAHAEVVTIRDATHQLGVVNLGHIKKEDAKLPQPHEWSHCVIYSSAEPCPMCLAAIYWAGIKQLAFAATRFDAGNQGDNFADSMIYQDLSRPYAKKQHIKVVQSVTDNSLDAFNYYKRHSVARYGKAKPEQAS